MIGQTIDAKAGHNIAIVGMGNLGRAVTTFIRKNDTMMNIVAGFDIDPAKVNEPVVGVPCFHISSVNEQIIELSVDIAVLTTSADAAQDIANELVDAWG